MCRRVSDLCYLPPLVGQGGGKGTSRPSSQYVPEPTQHTTRITPPPRRGQTRVPLNETSMRDMSSHRRADGGDDMAPLITNHRHPRTGDVSASAGLPDYSRPNEREYPIAPRKKSGPSESAGFDYYVGYAPEHEQPLPYVQSLSCPRSPLLHAGMPNAFSLCASRLRFAYPTLTPPCRRLFCLIFIAFVLVLDDRPYSSKTSTISLELGSAKHPSTPTSQHMIAGQYSSSTIRSDRFPLYRRN